MPSSMASLFLRAAARAAGSVAWAASHCATAAAAARSGPGGAASDPLMRASSVVASPAASSASAHHLPIAGSARPPRINPTRGPLEPPPPFDGPTFFNPDREIFEADEKDLQSDEALWALYERWCKFFDQKRDRDEMARWFSCFKETVLRVEENKKSDLPYRLGLNMFADGKLWELHHPEVPSTGFVRNMPYSASPIYAREPDF